MATDYQQLWGRVTTTTSEAQNVRALAGIVADKEGRVFISRLDSKEAVSCIDILDNVSRNLRFSLSPPPQALSSGHCRMQHRTSREAGILRHIEETY